jgi:hypothetical protein
LTERVAALRQRADEHRAIPARGTHRRTRGQRTEAVNLGFLSDSRRRCNKGSASSSVRHRHFDARYGAPSDVAPLAFLEWGGADLGGRPFAWQIFQELRTTPKPSAAKER